MSLLIVEDLIEAGTDEAGRGCLAGPVTAAAVIMPKDWEHPLLNDSKKLTEATRNKLRPIIEAESICYGVAHVSHEEIDKINILQASILAMHRALEQISTPEIIMVDGNKFAPFQNIPHRCIVKGDSKYISIAAASVLAKTHRDAHMLSLDTQFPEYNWKQNKGYPTKAHREAIAKVGPSPHHRKSFKLVETQLSFDF